MWQMLKIVLVSALPISELRGAIPLALFVYRLSPYLTYGLAILGNILPIFFLLWFWKTASDYLMKKSSFFNKLFSWLFQRTRNKAEKKFAIYGKLALILFVAIPLPFTGAWTGSIAAYLFKVPYWQAVSLIFIGILIAGLLITLSSLGIICLI
ncbi:MAG: small multi-drug export protein [Candidatus Aenigmarchaeota archaeon]|nr:small multi-drug export protein [Candidatus Aenigmarchaeota archaeon]